MRVDREAPAVADGHDEHAGDRRPERCGRCSPSRCRASPRSGRLRSAPSRSRTSAGPGCRTRACSRRPRRSRRTRRAARGGMNASAASANDWHISSDCVTKRRLRLSCAVDDHAGPRRQQQDRAELARRQHADRDSAAGAVEHEERQGDHRQPVARVGNRLADEEQPEVPRPERRERALDEAASAVRDRVIRCCVTAIRCSAPVARSAARRP